MRNETNDADDGDHDRALRSFEQHVVDVLVNNKRTFNQRSALIAE